MRHQSAGHGCRAGWSRVVGWVLRPPHKPFGVIGCVIEASGLVTESLACDVEQRPGEIEPAPLASHLMQRQQPLSDVAVVLEDADRFSDLPVARHPAEASVDDVHVGQQCSTR